jgi:nucleotide-binding universal stress UspA family protein
MSTPGATPHDPAVTDPSDRAPHPVVVGVDGSAASRRALLFAAGEAKLRRAVLRIVAAYDLGAAAYGYDGSFAYGPLGDGLREAAQQLVKASADTVATELPGPPVHVQTLVAQGRPSRVLLEAGSEAALLVVGARGAGALSRLVMGSTSTEVVHHARLPVTVVPETAVRSGSRTSSDW